MIQLSGSRCLAMSVVGTLFGWWMTLNDMTIMAHYRTLPHEALISELAKKNAGSLSADIVGGVLLIAAIVIPVDVLTRFFDAVWKRIEPSSSPS